MNAQPHPAAATVEVGRAPQLPRAPVLGWHDLLPWPGHQAPSFSDLAHRAFTANGRAALLAALRQLDLPAGSAVLVPTYHCPTMVAPIVHAGLQPIFYPIEPGGLPALDRIDESVADVRVMFVAHYFGLPLSLETVSNWCRARGIVLVEDCAHSFFGMAGERPVGHWGDFATASLVKFFPVPEGGLLGSQTRPLRPLRLHPQGFRAELKAVWDVVDLARAHGRLAGFSHLVAPLSYVRRRAGTDLPPPAAAEDTTPTPQAIRDSCDMGRAERRMTWAARALYRALPTGSIISRRRENYRLLSLALDQVTGARALRPELPEMAAPYVFPLWIDDEERADVVYTRLRMARMPVLRWDRHWPGTPRLPDDAGAVWSRQVLQLLCHQGLDTSDVAAFIHQIHAALAIGPDRGG